MTRARIILGAARVMYHLHTTPALSVEDAWNDTDNVIRAMYLKMARASYFAIAKQVPELFAVSSGSCLCREELNREPDIANDSGSQTSVTCHTCGGGYRG